MAKIFRLVEPGFTSRFSPCVLLGASIFLYLEVFILPRSPVLALGDQSIYLLNATRMLQGELIYRDFFHFTLPSTELVYATLFKLFGVRAWIPQAMLMFIGVSLVWLSIVISRKFLTGACVFLPGLLFLAFPFRSALDATHHWFSTLVVVAALAITIQERNPLRLAAAGAFCGLGACFTQSEGLVAVLGFACFLVWEQRQTRQPRCWLLKSEACLFGTFLATVIAFSAYFVWKAGLRRFVYCTVVFAVKYYPSDWYNTWRVYMTEVPPFDAWRGLAAWGSFLFIHALVPLAYILFFVRYWRVRAALPQQSWDRLMLVNVVGLALFAGVAPAPSYLRLCTVSLSALIILVWLVSQAGKLERIILRSLWVAALTLIVVGPVLKQRHWRAYLDLPTGRTAFLDPGQYHEYQWIFQRTRPPESFFGNQLICFALGLHDPAPVDFITPTDYTRPAQVASVVESLEREKVRYLTWYPQLDLPPPGAADHLGPLRAYLRKHYQVARTFANGDEVWERNH